MGDSERSAMRMRCNPVRQLTHATDARPYLLRGHNSILAPHHLSDGVCVDSAAHGQQVEATAAHTRSK
jgi:hypothetical protein